MWVFVIAALHGLFVIYVAHKWNSKVVTVLAAIGSAGAGVVTGNPAYMVADLVGVVIGLWIGIGIIVEVPAEPPKPVAAPTPPATPESEWGVWIVAAALIAGFFVYTSSKGTKPSPQATPSVTAPAPTPTVRYPAVATAQPAAAPQQVPKKAVKRQKTALQRCLEIPSDEKMTACLERLNE